MDDLIPFGSRDYGWLLLVALGARGADFLSTWVATPHLVLEANPIAKWLGWRWGAALNVAVCVGFAMWPLPAIMLITTSLLVAARNFQSAWIMRSLGEHQYRDWIVARYAASGFGLYLICLLGQTLLTATLGVALIRFSRGLLIPFGIGTGIITYAVVVAVYSLIAVARLRPQTS